MDSDCIISIPKLKTHCITVLTAAVKNTFGMVTGLYKAECHSKAPKEDDFAKIIAKVHSMTKPHLHILDGIIAMEGDGPSSGRPRKMEVLMASADAVAMDSCIAKMIGLEPLDIFVTREAYKMGLGEADPARIEITGDDVASFITEDFELPQTLPLKFLPKALAHSVANFVRFKPFIDRDVCRRCNLCRISCPVGAINTNDGDYTVNYKRCIRCMCCHEVCPYRAITIRRNILTKMIWG
jgi:Pyruvate/2-oxoacid:ferredoxin oxidoreductase delta subunit